MTFAEKLVFLMELTSTSNKQLAVAAYVDPSFISLLRTARREAPKNMKLTREIAAYLARKCESDYHRIALMEVMGKDKQYTGMTAEQLSNAIFIWLSDGQTASGGFPNAFDTITLAQNDDNGAQEIMREGSKNLVYYGNEGKRAAFAALIDYAETRHEAGEILISSDENSAWLFEDESYIKSLINRVFGLLDKGYTIKRIAARIESIEQVFERLPWLTKLYFTGRVESRYYPRLRDEVFKRTIVAISDAAVVSTSVGSNSESGATILMQDKRLTETFIREFYDYYGMCSPATMSYSANVNMDDVQNCLMSFEKFSGRSIRQSSSLSAITTPVDAISAICANMPAETGASMLSFFTSARTEFLRNISEQGVTEIHTLSSYEDIVSGKVRLLFGQLYSGAETHYTPETYAKHIRQILELSEKNEGYNPVFRVKDEFTSDIYVKEGRRAIVIKPDAPVTVQEISLVNMAEAFNEYLVGLAEKTSAKQGINAAYELLEKLTKDAAR